MAHANRAIDQMETAWKSLCQQWEKTSQVWRDQRAREFEKQHWEPLTREVPALLQEMRQMAQVMRKALRNVP